MIIICHHCKHEWNYKGNGEYGTCPKCHYKVNVSKALKNIGKKVSESKLKVSKEIKKSELNTQGVSEYETQRVSKYEKKGIEGRNTEERIRRIEEEIQEMKRAIKYKTPIKIKPKGILIKCQKCEYEWYFTGLKKIARCPECNARVNVEESIIREE